MNIGWVIAVAVALGADAFSLSLAIGLTGIRKSLMVRLSLVVAAFHVFMPLIGMVVGQALGSVLGHFATIIGALVLIVLGGQMLYSVYRPKIKNYSFKEARKSFKNKSSFSAGSLEGWGMYALAVSVSLDALSVGFSLGTMETNVFLTVIIMGLIAGTMTAAGLILGGIIGTWLGDKAEALGGFALLLIGIKLLL